MIATWVIQAGGAGFAGVPKRFHTLDSVLQPWSMSPELALRFARVEDAQDYCRVHLAAGHAVVAYETARSGE